MSFWRTLSNHLETGEPAFLALVADNTAHSPGTRGAKMFVRPDGSTHGTIGGGIMEAGVLQMAAETLAAGRFEAPDSRAPDSRARRQVLYHRKKGGGDKSGLICAGHQTNVYYVCDSDEDRQVVAEAARRQLADEPGVIEIGQLGMRTRPEGRVGPDIPPVELREDAQNGWRYAEQLLNWKRAAIVGGGHCGLALSRVLSGLGYAVAVFDARADVFTMAQNDWARRKVVVADYAQVGEHIRHPAITHVIIMTKGQPTDVRALLGTIEGPYPYIGVMGSPAKLSKIRADLLAHGIDEALLDRLYAPIGLPMTSNTPAEIAISIAAELLQERETLFPHSRPAKPQAPAE